MSHSKVGLCTAGSFIRYEVVQYPLPDGVEFPAEVVDPVGCVCGVLRRIATSFARASDDVQVGDTSSVYRLIPYGSIKLE